MIVILAADRYAYGSACGLDRLPRASGSIGPAGVLA
jgi:hypothetical protein